jgi:hypothetical protein
VVLEAYSFFCYFRIANRRKNKSAQMALFYLLGLWDDVGTFSTGFIAKK